MLIVWDSFTGNVERFINKLNMRNIRIRDGLIVDEPFILITYTTGFGQVPDKVSEFLEFNSHFLKYVIGSGNKSWGNNFAKSADIISEKYQIPILSKIELSGTKLDVGEIKKEVNNLSTE